MTAENIVIQQENVPTVTEKRKTEEDGETESIVVEGLALPFDEESRNGVVYTKESIKETADQMIGVSVLWNHDDSIPSLGRVVDTEIKEDYSEGKDGLYYKMELDTQGELESKVARKLEKGYINNVSIQAAVDDEGLEAPKVAVQDWYELTICNIAGFPQTNTDTSEQTVEGVPARVQLNGRSNMTEMALAESLNDKSEKQTLTEAFEEAPSYDLLLSLYEDEDDAQERAEELGLDEVHSYEVDGETMYMAGESHEAWKDAVDDEMQDDEEGDEDVKGEPFAGYDDFEACVADNQDKNDPEAYCGELKDRAEELDEVDGENSNKNGASESNGMSEDTQGDGEGSDEKPDNIEEMVEQMQETVDELADRVEAVEEQVASMSEAEDDEGQENQEEDEEGDGEGESKQGFDPENAQDATESTRSEIAETLRE